MQAYFSHKGSQWVLWDNKHKMHNFVWMGFFGYYLWFDFLIFLNFPKTWFKRSNSYSLNALYGFIHLELNLMPIGRFCLSLYSFINVINFICLDHVFETKGCWKNNNKKTQKLSRWIKPLFQKLKSYERNKSVLSSCMKHKPSFE